MYQLACSRIAKASASSSPTPRRPSDATPSHWYVPTNPGDDGIATPRFMTAATKKRLQQAELDVEGPGDDNRRERPRAPRDEAQADPDRRAGLPEWLGEQFGGVTQDSAHEPATAPLARAAGRVLAREDENRTEHQEPEEGAERDADQPVVARYSEEPDREEREECEEIAAAIEHHGSESPSGRNPGVEAEPARAKEVAETPRKHVVAGDAADDQLVEVRRADRARVRDRPPAQRLERVHREHRDDGDCDEPGAGVLERVANRGGVGVARGEPEEENADRHADHEAGQCPVCP